MNKKKIHAVDPEPLEINNNLSEGDIDCKR